MYSHIKSQLVSPIRLFLSATLVLITGLPLQTVAENVLEEVLVTATRRGETDIQVTPISVTSLNEDDLDNLLMHDLKDMTAAVPNLVEGNAPAFNSFQPSLRGVGKDGIIIYNESPVGVSIDDFVIPHVQTQSIQPFDIESIEVLRGPQGTLFGKNTTAGQINVRTKRPELNNRSIEVRASYAEFDAKETKYAANYGTDTFAFRAAGMYRKTDGYYEAGKTSTSFDPLELFNNGNFVPETFVGDGRDLAGEDVFSGRFKALWQPNDDFTALAQFEIIRDNGDSPVTVAENEPISVFTSLGFAGVASGDPVKQSNQSSQSTFFNMNDGHQVDVDGYYLNMDWTVGDYTIHSVTGYREEESRLANTYMGEARTSLFDASRDDNRETIQQEIRIDSNYDGRFNYTLGAFYQHSDVKFCVTQVLGFLDFFGPGFAPNTLLGGFTDGTGAPLALATNSHNDNASILCNSQKAKAAAIFADATFDFTDRMQVGFGVRQSYENKKWAGRSQTFFQFLNGTANGADEGLFATLGENLDAADFKRFPFNVHREEQSWTDPSFRVTGGYAATDDIYTWITWSRSVKSGAFNDQTGTSTIGLPIPFSDPLQTAPINPEFATSLEVGLKMDLFNNRVRLNLVYFDVKYDDAQRQLNASTGNFQETLFFNAAVLDVRGIEFEGSWAVMEGLTVSGNWSYQDAEFTSFQADTDFDGTIDVDLSGKAVNRSPKWTAFITANYEHSLGDMGLARHNLSASFVDDSIFTYSDLGSAFDAMSDNRTVVNWSTTLLDKSEKYFIRGFGRNLTDERYRTGNLAVAALWTMASYGQPRQFGVEIGAKFDF